MHHPCTSCFYKHCIFINNISDLLLLIYIYSSADTIYIYMWKLQWHLHGFEPRSRSLSDDVLAITLKQHNNTTIKSVLPCGFSVIANTSSDTVFSCDLYSHSDFMLHLKTPCTVVCIKSNPTHI